MASDLDGTRVAVANRYRLDAPIARGGMGTVWRAEDTLLRRPVAVKEILIPPALSGEDDSVRVRVMREAQAAARLSHPRTVAVYDIVEQDDRIWLVMELVEAGSLADLIEAEGPIAPHRAAALGVGLVSALEAAHRSGIVHRDVKPGNVLVLPDGSVKLADFGIASLRDDPRITRTGMVLGSPSFMAPEQAKGESTGPSVDVWGLGATVWYAVAGKAPFSRDTAIATLGAIVNEPVEPPEAAGPLTPVLCRLLAKDPAERPSMEEAGRLLAAVAAADAPHADGYTAAAPLATAAALATSVHPVTDPPGTLPAAAPVSARRQRAVLAAPRRARAPRSSSSGWGWAAALLAVLVLIGGALLVASAVRDDDGGDDVRATAPSTTETSDGAGSSTTASTAAPTTATTAPPATTASSAPPTTTATTAAPTTTPTTAAPPPPSPSLPDGWVAFQDEATGYAIGYPAGWQVERVNDIRTRFRDPATGDSLLVEWTDDPGPSALGAWEEQEQYFRANNDGYERIRLENVDYRGYDAAVWEFRWRSDSGSQLHGHDLGIVTGDYGFALFSVAAESRWDEAYQTFETMAAVFAPPGS